MENDFGKVHFFARLSRMKSISRLELRRLEAVLELRSTTAKKGPLSRVLATALSLKGASASQLHCREALYMEKLLKSLKFLYLINIFY